MSLDAGVESGIVDFTNEQHVELLAMHLFDRGANAQIVAEVVNKIAIRDGKYPDRQAFNKDGWLVTFPSPEYKQAAIKKRTHFESDPTNGKGGMTMYHKKKGHQSRPDQQDVSAVEPNESPEGQPTDSGETQAPTSAPQSAQGQEGGKDGETLPKSNQGSSEQAPQKSQPSQPNGSSNSSLPSFGGGDQQEQPQGKEPSDKIPTSSSNGSSDSEKGPQGGGQAQSPQQQTPSISATSISVEFAKSKTWVSTPYGDWTSQDGTKVAVTGLTGEVVPIQSKDREELKLLFDKKTQNG